MRDDDDGGIHAVHAGRVADSIRLLVASPAVRGAG